MSDSYFKPSSPPNDQPFSFEVSERDDSADAKEIHERLRSDVEAEVGASGRQSLTIAARSENDALAGGLRGYSHWGWLYLSHLWVRADARSSGLGRALVAKAEVEARARGCFGLYVDTFSARAKSFYENSGFEEYGRLEDFPPGHTRYFLRKSLS